MPTYGEEFSKKLYQQYSGTREVTDVERKVFSEIMAPPPMPIPVGTWVIVNLPDQAELKGVVIGNDGTEFPYMVQVDEDLAVGANHGEIRVTD